MNYDIKYISAESSDYPMSLRLIDKPPKGLYYIGRLSLLRNMSVAIVGSRHATEYGKWVAKTLGQRLSENGITVVSGLAMGIDTFGHRGALLGEGNTIAVLGGGIDVGCIAQNRSLMERIAQGGLVISEYPPGTHPHKGTFPERNRIISGLAAATVVVEAGVNSGSLITAECAIQQGRCVLAVPGNITSINSMGTNKLIFDGAIPLIVIDEIFTELGINRKENRFLEKNLGMDENAILECIGKSGEVGIDYICRALSMDAGKVSGLITVLEMKGMVCTSLGKIFIAK